MTDLPERISLREVGPSSAGPSPRKFSAQVPGPVPFPPNGWRGAGPRPGMAALVADLPAGAGSLPPRYSRARG